MATTFSVATFGFSSARRRCTFERMSQAGACALACVVLLFLYSTPSLADESGWVTAERQASRELRFSYDSAPVLRRQVGERPTAITRLAAILPRLLQASELRDNPISLGAQCPLEDGAAPCHETYAPPSATGEWRGFDPTQVIEAHSQAVQARERGTRKSTFESAGLRIVDTDDGTTISRDGIFRLQILEAGDGFRFINYLNGYGARNNANARLDASDAERLGRSLISDFDLAPLGPDEELTFLGTRYAHFTGNASDPGDRVVGTRAYFGRKVDGIPVIGEGSRIVIEFAHGVRVLDVNWSGLERSGTRQVRAAAPEIVRRVQSQRASLNLRSVPFESLDAMCGLYDGGARSGSSELALTCLTRDRSLADASEMMTSIREAGAQNVDSSEQGLRIAETDKGCSATPLGGGPDTRRALHRIALLACGALFRRRRARWLARIFVPLQCRSCCFRRKLLLPFQVSQT